MADQTKDIYYTENLDVPETPDPGIPLTPWRTTRVIGKPLPRVDAYERVSGSAVYPSDVAFADMLYGAIVRCPHPNARVKRVSTGAAEAMRGVRRVLTASSPGADLVWPYGGSGNDSKLFDPHCRFEGDVVAAVAAETPYVAADAARAISVDYEVLPFVVDEMKALEDGAPKVHEGGNRVKDAEIYMRGDVEQGFKAADVVVERTFHTACELQTPLELHGCVAKWDGDKLTVWESTQGVYAVQSVLASVLGLSLSRIRVVGHYMGGGFGAKLRPGKYTVIAALLAKQTGRPVKVFVDREATFLALGNRPPATMTMRAGAKKDGTLTALQFHGLGTGGAYAAGGTSRMDWLVRDLYLCPNVKTETQDVFINAGPARPFRAPGHPQGAWALEQVLDELAIKLGMDAVALRLKNISDKSQARDGSPPYTTTGLRKCLEEGAKQFGWKASRRRAEETKKSGHVRRGVGMASCLWVAGGGGPPSTVLVKVFADGSVNLTMGASDIGTGTKSVMAMVVSEELGVRPEFIQIEHADTGTTQYATASGGSKTVPTEAPAVRAAAIDAKRQLLEMASEDLGVPAAQLRMEAGEVTTKDGKRLPIPKIERLKKRQSVVGVGYRGPNPEGKVVNPFAAQFCEVEVNTLTGELRILRFLGAHDSGRVMNRLTFDNQIFGGIVMGIGYATTEERVLDHGQTGKMLNRNWHDYKLPTALDVPSDMTTVAVDPGDQEANTVGAKGLGEPATIPTAAAIANAIFHATGVRVTDTPVNPVRLNQLLMERDKEG